MSYWHYQLMYHKRENPAAFEGDGYYIWFEWYTQVYVYCYYDNYWRRQGAYLYKEETE